MKKVLLLLVAVLFTSVTFSQAIYFDDFESYNVGDYLAENSDDWTTWSGAPGTGEDAFISDAQSTSGTQSVVVEGVSDLVKPLGDLTSGRYELSFDYYVPDGFGAYYNIQHFEQPGIEWAMEVYFGSNGEAEVNAGGTGAATFNFNHDQWLEIVHLIDLTNDAAELWVDGNLIHEWQFSLQADGSAGELQLGGVNMYAGANTGDTPMYYFDDFNFEQLPTTLFFDDFESYTLGGLVGDESDFWETWSGTGGGADDAPAVDTYALSGSQSMEIAGSSDMVAPLGNKTSGEYKVSFNYYIPSGFGGYYNIQHFEEPGIEWAYEVYFGETGEGYLTVGGVDYFFNYNHDEWFYIENWINLDEDWAEVFIDGQLIHEFVFSQIANTGDPGELQLGGVNIYAGAPTGETATYYVDDFEWLELSSSTDPMISVDPLSLEVALDEGMVTDQSITVENVGFADLEYEVDIVYDVMGKKNAVLAPAPSNNKTKTAKLETAEAPNYKPGDAAPAREDVVLNYDGENNSAIGLTNPGEWEAAVRFPNEMVVEYAGMELTSVDVYINDLVEAYELRIYGEGMNNQAGELLASKAFSPNAMSWHTIVLDEPVVVTGEDLWVGYWMDQQGTDVFPAGVDAGPADPNGDFIKSGVAWGHLGATDANWNIRALLTGEAQSNWLSVSPEEGTIAPSESVELTVTFDATGLDNGTYNATIEINNNDPEMEIVEVPVTMDIVTGVNEIGENNAIVLFPNPVKDYVQIQANHKITNVKIMNYAGQLVYQSNIEGESVRINTSDFTSGVYIVQIETTADVITKQIIVE